MCARSPSRARRRQTEPRTVREAGRGQELGETRCPSPARPLPSRIAPRSRHRRSRMRRGTVCRVAGCTSSPTVQASSAKRRTSVSMSTPVMHLNCSPMTTDDELAGVLPSRHRVGRACPSETRRRRGGPDRCPEAPSLAALGQLGDWRATNLNCDVRSAVRRASSPTSAAVGVGSSWNTSLPSSARTYTHRGRGCGRARARPAAASTSYPLSASTGPVEERLA